MLLVEDEPYLAKAIRDGLRLEAIAADIAGDGDTALELLSVNAYDIAVLDRDIPGPSGDEIAKRIAASGSEMPIPRVRCSLSRTPARSSPHSWFHRLPSRFAAAPNAYAPTPQVWASAWQSSKASPKHTTELSP